MAFICAALVRKIRYHSYFYSRTCHRAFTLIKLIHKKIRNIFSKEGEEVHKSIIARNQHNISRKNISEPALKVLYRLKDSGYEAYLVGGGVRDSLLGLHPKDFDVTTNATPEQVNQLFRNSRLIGRRFRLVHVVFGREVIEVATFRATPSTQTSNNASKTSTSGMILRDNVYGNQDEDAMRRDFTINALYYNIVDFSVHAYAGGWEDLQERKIRLIGDPHTRYHEDPVRMLRAIRFKAKLGFEIEEETAAPIDELAPLLLQIPPARLFDEVLKLLLHGQALTTFRLLREYGLFKFLFPAAEDQYQHNEAALLIAENTMRNTDKRIASGRSVTPYFFISALLWPALKQQQQKLIGQGLPPAQALQLASDQVISAQIKNIAIPKRFTIPMREVWQLQPRLNKTQGKRTLDLLAHPRFRAAYDFLLLRQQSGEELKHQVQFWTDLQEKHPDLVGSRANNPAYDATKTITRKRKSRNRNNRSKPR